MPSLRHAALNPWSRFRRAPGAAIQAEVIASMASPTDLYEEILFNGCLLSRRACPPMPSEMRRLQGPLWRAGDSESTLSAIGEIHGITRERIRQIVDKQLSFLPTTTVLTAQFDALQRRVRSWELLQFQRLKSGCGVSWVGH